VVGGLVALWFGIDRGLSPLKTLRETLRDKRTDDTSPIDDGHAPTELRPVIGAMNGLLNRLAQAMAHQRAFTDAAAHELRTPLTAIDTHLQVARLVEGEEAHASLRQAEEGVRRLRHTLDQMMTLARTEASTQGVDPCASVSAVVSDMLARMNDAARARIVLSASGTDAGTPMPKHMLDAGIRNLVDNALRYSPADQPITLNVAFDSREQRCRIEVADRGPGLNDKQAEQIGQRFWRGDQGRRQGEGAGLGISIVRAIADRFGGALELMPREGGGLRAVLQIPLI
jgi:two-component system sensor histidine kinase QseC